MAEYEKFLPDGGFSHYDPTIYPNTELYGSPQTSAYGQFFAERDVNSSPINIAYYAQVTNQGFAGFLGTYSYEQPEAHVLPYRQPYFGESPFDLQPILDIPYPWATGE